MKDLSVTEQYTLLALSRGRNPLAVVGERVSVAIVAAELLELAEQGSLQILPGKHTSLENYDIFKPVKPPMEPYLRPLYERMLKHGKQITTNNLVSDLFLNVGDSPLAEMQAPLLKSLEEKGSIAPKTKHGLFRPRQVWEVNVNDAEGIIRSLRENLLEAETPAEGSVILSVLFDKSGLLNHYFSRYEHDVVETRMSSFNEDQSGRVTQNLVTILQVIYAAMMVGFS